MAAFNDQPSERLKAEPQAAREALRQLVSRRYDDIALFLQDVDHSTHAHVLPVRTRAALWNLSEIRAIMFGSRQVLSDPSKPADLEDIAALLKNVQALSAFAQKEMAIMIANPLKAKAQTLIRR